MNGAGTRLQRHADIVLPCTTSLERHDIALTPKDPYQVVMDQVIAPVGQARNDHEIFCGIAAEMGVEDAFTEGRSTEEWLRWIWGCFTPAGGGTGSYPAGLGDIPARWLDSGAGTRDAHDHDARFPRRP